MTLNLLDHFLLSQIFAFLLIFCRIGSTFMVVPGIAENYVPMQVRLLFALLFSVMLTPMLQPSMPQVPANIGSMMLMISAEVMIGVLLGMMVRIVLSAVHVAGTAIAAQSSLALASVFDVGQGGQSAIVSNFLSMTVLTCFFAMNLHHILIAGLVDSYNLFTVGHFPIAEDMANTVSRKVADAFTIGVQLSAPHLAFSLLFYLFSGLLTRIMPNFQVFFVLIPPQLMMAMLLLMIILSTMVMFFMNHVEDELLQMVRGS